MWSRRSRTFASGREHWRAVLESVLGATPQEFESLILRHADLRKRDRRRLRSCLGFEIRLQKIKGRGCGTRFEAGAGGAWSGAGGEHAISDDWRADWQVRVVAGPARDHPMRMRSCRMRTDRVGAHEDEARRGLVQESPSEIRESPCL
jgi:hypothetical protein